MIQSKTAEAPTNARAVIANVAASLAHEIYRSTLADVRAPDDEHKVVPIVTVSLEWRTEKK